MSYEPGHLSYLLYEEDDYQVTACNSHITINRSGLCRGSSGLNIEEIPPALSEKLIKHGYDPKDFIYVPYILIKAAAKNAIEAFAHSLREYERTHYVRAIHPGGNK